MGHAVVPVVKEDLRAVGLQLLWGMRRQPLKCAAAQHNRLQRRAQALALQVIDAGPRVGGAVVRAALGGGPGRVAALGRCMRRGPWRGRLVRRAPKEDEAREEPATECNEGPQEAPYPPHSRHASVKAGREKLQGAAVAPHHSLVMCPGGPGGLCAHASVGIRGAHAGHKAHARPVVHMCSGVRQFSQPILSHSFRMLAPLFQIGRVLSATTAGLRSTTLSFTLPAPGGGGGGEVSACCITRGGWVPFPDFLRIGAGDGGQTHVTPAHVPLPSWPPPHAHGCPPGRPHKAACRPHSERDPPPPPPPLGVSCTGSGGLDAVAFIIPQYE